MKSTRLDSLPETMRLQLKQTRLERGWSQRELGERAGLPQMHISAIETGKVVPRYDTLLDLVRILDHDLVLVPRALVPAVNALIRDYLEQSDEDGGEGRVVHLPYVEPNADRISPTSKPDWEEDHES